MGFSKHIEVASGSFSITTHKNQILQAHLGTCVGVTLCDRTANVGGLIHILLPEPTGAYKTQQPAIYASSGLPLFIQSIQENGGDLNKLEACIAGGALIGPLSENDLMLDIGGRTTEIVEDILLRKKITISKTETGGYSGSRLSLDSDSWQSHVDPLELFESPHKLSDFQRPKTSELDLAIERVRPIPQIALKVIRMIRDDDYSMNEIAEHIRQDQVISAKLLRICNSSLFFKNRKIDSINRALVLLGEKKLLQLVVSASLEDFFPIAEQGYSLCKGGLFKHALSTALICEKLAQYTGKADGGMAYTAGLLHDMGKVLLDQFLAPAFPLFYRRTQEEAVNLIEVEQEEFGFTHTEAGGRLAEHWSLPDTLVEVMRHHHQPEQAKLSNDLTLLVYISDLVASQFLVGQELERLNPNHLSLGLKKLGIHPENFPILIETIQDQLYAGSHPDGFTSFSDNG